MIFQSLFCKHDYKEINRSKWTNFRFYENVDVIVYMCKKCNKVKKVIT